MLCTIKKVHAFAQTFLLWPSHALFTGSASLFLADIAWLHIVLAFTCFHKGTRSRNIAFKSLESFIKCVIFSNDSLWHFWSLLPHLKIVYIIPDFFNFVK
jgi:hypothetical protein